MKVEITDLSACMKQVFVEIPEDTVNEQFQRVSMMVAQNANIAGFRRGRVPLSLVKNRYRKEIHDQVMRDLLPTALHSAIVENRLPMVGDPSIDEVQLKEGSPFIFKARLEVIPEFELKEYKGLKLTRKTRIITDEMVEKRLEELRKQHATLTPVEDREACEDDFVTVSLHGKYMDTEKPEEDINIDSLPLWLNSQETMKEFVQNAIGLKIGEEKSFEVSYEQNHPNQKFAGKRLSYRIRLTSIKVKELPELDDDFAKSIGDFETLEEFRNDIRRSFEEAAKQEADSRLQDEVFRTLLEGQEFDVPEILVQSQLRERLNTFRMQLARSGVDPRSAQIDWKQIADSQRPAAKRDVRVALIIEKIAAAEGIDVSEAELDEEITRIAGAVGATVEATRSRLTKEGGIDSIKGRIRNRKAVDFVIKSAEISEEAVSSEELDRLDHARTHDSESIHEHGSDCDHGHEG